MPYHVGIRMETCRYDQITLALKGFFSKKIKDYGIIVLNSLSLVAALPITVTLFLCITTREGAEPRIVTVRSIRTNNGIACEE